MNSASGNIHITSNSAADDGAHWERRDRDMGPPQRRQSATVSAASVPSSSLNEREGEWSGTRSNEWMERGKGYVAIRCSNVCQFVLK